MKRKLLIIFVVILIAYMLLGCAKGKPQEVTQNGDFKVEFLFEQDGCKMYRFKDGKRYIYWVNQTGKVNSDFTQHSGKSSQEVYVESITTNTADYDTLKNKIKKLLE